MAVAPDGTGGAVVIPTKTGMLPPESAGPLLMRRLTYREYDHMMAELLGDTTAPAEGGAWTNDTPNEVGYIAPTSVADLQVNLYSQAADTLVDNAVNAVAAGKPAGKFIIPCKTAPATAAEENSCATQFITAFGLAAYRRPVAAAEQMDLLALFTKVRGLGLAFNQSLGAIAKAVIQSPNFLYHWEMGPTKPVAGADGLVPLTPWQTSARLASLLWETMPDDALLQAAQSDQLATPAAISAQVTRMMSDSRAANGLFSFHQQWLLRFGSQERDMSVPLIKNGTVFTPAAALAVPVEFSMFLAAVYTGAGTLQELFTAPYTYVNRDLAPIYGVEAPATGFAKVQLDPKQRSGIFTQTGFLASLADEVHDNPVYRGLSVYEKVLCGTVGGPPPNVPGANFVAGGTTRQAIAKHGDSACASFCHSLFDPPGFAFENYDTIGAYRTMEAGQPVDSTGSFKTPGNATLSFQNGVDLAKQLAQSAEAQACINRQWTRYMLGRTETDAEAGSMGLAQRAASATPGFSVRDLVASLASSKAFLYRKLSPGETP